MQACLEKRCLWHPVRFRGPFWRGRPVLSLSVVLFVAVQGVMECLMRVDDVTVRCVCVAIRCGLLCLCYKPLLAASQALSLRTHPFALFLEHPTSAVPRSVKHAAQNCAILLGSNDLDTEQVVCSARSTSDPRRESLQLKLD